ncbi:O-antigen ligase family protein [Pseudomonas sp. UBA2684]|uniref:O-antigen ligase family protein n=1 Tax=Pseudomonas sp. UBA2684 TaxID=1947311 RepID=UPI000E9231C6|nr:O-antigen ligase family protein [Pseudomonas sp. UBA2684]HBX57826.1 hypothetical protein [Pseudomonas sp.]|tara:strand:+ start:21018 stop:22415 length:1398 start_codon:yes stop_codon:yes gene_type:complete
MMPIGVGIAIFCGLFFGALLWVLSLPKLMILIAGSAFALTVMRTPLIGLLIFAFVAAFLPYSTLEVGVRTTASEALLALTWVGVLWQGFLSKQPRLYPRSGTERALGWLLMWSAIPFVVGQFVIQAEGGGPTNWIRWMLNLSAMFLVIRLIQDDNTAEKLTVAMLLGTLAMLLLSLGVFAKSRDANALTPILTALKYPHQAYLEDMFTAGTTRLSTPWLHPNSTGGALAITIPVALFFALPRPGWKRALGLSVALLGSAGLLLSGSRGALLSLGLVVIWMASRRVPYTARILIAGIAFGCMLVLVYPPLQERLATMFLSSNASTGIRLQEYAMFPEAMARYPLGIGFKVDPPVPGSGLMGISNLWLNFIYKLGVPGMLLFIAVTWFWWRETRPYLGAVRVTRENSLWLGCSSGLLCALLTGIFDHYFSLTYVLIAFFWLFIGLTLQQVRLHPEIISPMPTRRASP